MTAVFAVVGCDADTEVPDHLVLDRGDTEPDDGAPPDEPTAESQVLAACEWLGADRGCGAEGTGIQYCAWLYNEDMHEISTYWGECLAEPECVLWSCREADAALCDLVDGKPQWMPASCEG